MDIEQTHLDKTYILAANKAAKDFTYGQVIKRQWLIDNFLLVEPETGTRKDFEAFAFEYLECIEGIKKHMLEEHQMCLKSVRGEGYMIVMPKDQSGYAMDNLKDQVGNATRKAISILNNVNTALLSSDDIRRRDESHGKIAALAAYNRTKLRISDKKDKEESGIG